jgi:hypothetical protein
MDKYNANPTLNGVLLPEHLDVMDNNQLVNNPPPASLPENNSTVETEAFDGSGSDVNIKIMADPMATPLAPPTNGLLSNPTPKKTDQVPPLSSQSQRTTNPPDRGVMLT